MNQQEQRGQAGGPTIEQLLALHSIGGSEGPQWSPNGDTLAFVSSLAGAPELWSIDVESGRLRRLSVGLGGVGHLVTFMPRWSPTGEYIAVVSARSGSDELWLWPADGGPLRQLTRLSARIEAYSWAPDGGSIVFSGNRNGRFDLWRVTVPDGTTTQLTNDPCYEVYPSVAPDGRVVYVRLNERWTDHDVILMGPDGSEPHVILQDTDFFDYHYGRSFGSPLISPDGASFLFRSQRSGWINIWEAPLSGGGPARSIANATADQSDAAWSPDGRAIAYIENHNGTLELRVVPANGGPSRRLVVPEPFGVCSAPAWSPDGTKIAYLYTTPTCPADIWLVDVATGARRQLTDSMLGGQFAQRLVVPEKVRYQSFDGLSIAAYLYRPQNRSAGERFPGIVWVHGGPTSQYYDTPQPAVQFFVSQGYVVLLPNIRGSSGYGRAFEELNDRDWGHGDLLDVVAGVEFLKTLPDVDVDNFGITGTSYGGIMTMAATVWAPPGVFKAAIACSGYGNFENMHAEEELRHVKLLQHEFGDLPAAVDIYRRCSPIHSVANAHIPCFVLHGEGRYPGSNSGREFALALERNYKPVWYKTYPNETYYVASPANVHRQWLDMLAFFDMHLKGIAHALPDGVRPLTHLSGVLGSGARVGSAGGSGGTTPPRDVAN